MDNDTSMTSGSAQPLYALLIFSSGLSEQRCLNRIIIYKMCQRISRVSPGYKGADPLLVVAEMRAT